MYTITFLVLFFAFTSAQIITYPQICGNSDPDDICLRYEKPDIVIFRKKDEEFNRSLAFIMMVREIHYYSDVTDVKHVTCNEMVLGEDWNYTYALFTTTCQELGSNVSADVSMMVRVPATVGTTKLWNTLLTLPKGMLNIEFEMIFNNIITDRVSHVEMVFELLHKVPSNEDMFYLNVNHAVEGLNVQEKRDNSWRFNALMDTTIMQYNTIKACYSSTNCNYQDLEFQQAPKFNSYVDVVSDSVEIKWFHQHPFDIEFIQVPNVMSYAIGWVGMSKKVTISKQIQIEQGQYRLGSDSVYNDYVIFMVLFTLFVSAMVGVSILLVVCKFWLNYKEKPKVVDEGIAIIQEAAFY